MCPFTESQFFNAVRIWIYFTSSFNLKIYIWNKWGDTLPPPPPDPSLATLLVGAMNRGTYLNTTSDCHPVALFRFFHCDGWKRRIHDNSMY